MPVQSKNLCVFCGEAFAGKPTDFEHVIPKWLVKEANLSKRTMKVDVGTRAFNAAMNRIGAWACKKCNGERSSFEKKAKGVYEKLRDGAPLTQADGRTLLDWLDKVRVGLWLWLNNAHPESERLSPKFHINDRMATADRIALVTKYNPNKSGKGLAFFGVDKPFHLGPSVLGFMANNLVFYSISSNFFLLRHIRGVKVTANISGGLEKDVVEVKPTLGKDSALTLMGNPLAIGQCIFDQGIFEENHIAPRTMGVKTKLGESAIWKLSHSLNVIDEDLGALTENRQEHFTNLTLLKLNAARISRFLINDYLQGNFPIEFEHQKVTAKQLLELKEAQILKLVSEYHKSTGIRLPI